MENKTGYNKASKKNLHVHYLSYEDRALAARLVAVLERLVDNFDECKRIKSENKNEAKETLSNTNSQNTNNPGTKTPQEVKNNPQKETTQSKET